MPAKKFLDEFKFDPATFNYDEFKKRMESEIATDDDLTTAKITGLEGERDTLTQSERDLKIALFDATVKRQGTPVTPQDSPTQGGGNNDSAPKVQESDIFEKVE